MGRGSLVTEQIDAGADVAREFDHDWPLRAAFWLSDSDGDWYLYLVSDRIDDTNVRAAYRAVSGIVRPAPNLWLDLFQIKVAGPEHPVAKAVLGLQHDIDARHGKLALSGTRLRDQFVGGMYATELYLYPIPVPAAGT